MYLIGNDPEQRARARSLLEQAIGNREKLVTSADVLQEILHRYVAVARRDAIQPTFDALLGLVDEVFPVEVDQVQRARVILLERHRLSARDALHLATMERFRVNRIMSFDSGFDHIPGVTRLPP